MSRPASRPLAFSSRPALLCRPAVRSRRSARLRRRRALPPVSRRVTSPASLPGSASSLAPRAYSQVTSPSLPGVTSQVAPARLVTIRRRPSAQAGPRTSNPCAASLAATARIAAPGSPLWAAALPQWSIAVVTGMCPPQQRLSRCRQKATRGGPAAGLGSWRGHGVSLAAYAVIEAHFVPCKEQKLWTGCSTKRYTRRRATQQPLRLLAPSWHAFREKWLQGGGLWPRPGRPAAQPYCG